MFTSNFAVVAQESGDPDACFVREAMAAGAARCKNELKLFSDYQLSISDILLSESFHMTLMTLMEQAFQHS